MERWKINIYLHRVILGYVIATIDVV